ncbi:MAG: SulP family inorganic anion transporter [Myxococcota bacterium]
MWRNDTTLGYVYRRMSAAESEMPLRQDLTASVVVFLVALPLCLGIALASGAPLIAGLVAGVVGGAVVALVSDSEVSVSGPAAGLTVIVASAITTLGSYEAFLAAVVIAGVVQLVFGALRLGVFGDYVPSSVIKGLLAAIGIVIVLKQIPHALGRDFDFEGEMAFLEPDGKENTLSAIVKAVLSFRGAAVLVTAAALGVLLTWDQVTKRFPRLKVLPAALVAVLAGTALNELFALLWPGFALEASAGHLVSLPVPESLQAVWDGLRAPDWGALKTQQVYVTGITLAVVASVESLLSLEASEKLDPYRRYASPHRELFAQGLGNIASGLLGGLPVTSVVVRTSANVQAGGRTRRSALAHAALLALAAVLLPRILNHVPLSALAAVLIVVGVKLAPVKLFKEMWAEGPITFAPFIATVVAIVFTDLLKGVMIGLAFGVLVVLRANRHAAMTLVSQDRYHLLRFNKDLTFLNKAELKAKLDTIPEGATLIVDGTRALTLDRDIFDVLADFEATAAFRNITVEEKNLRGKRPAR